MYIRNCCAAILQLARSVRDPVTCSASGPVNVGANAPPGLSGYALFMIEENREEVSPHPDASSTTSEDMAEALDAVKASSPALAEAIDEAKISPGELAESHERATSEDTTPRQP